MSIDIAGDCPAAAASAKRDLRRENEHLRRLLGRAETVAERYAMMLREGDHRIKNSLQIVASLMGLQAGREQSLPAKTALRTAAARIQSIAVMHDALQQSGGQDTVDLGAILEKMCRALHAMAGEPSHVSVVIATESIETPVKLAQPIVLAVNELVVNALRHAFPGDRPGTVRISVARIGGDLRITVADDGAGLPADYDGGHGYGMKLVRSMVRQVGGELLVDSEGGARFTIVAPTSAPVSNGHGEVVSHRSWVSA